MFWDVFSNLCLKKGKSPNAIGKELNLSSGSITFWKQGKVPHHNTLLKLAKYFNVSVDYLLGKEEKSTNTSIIKVPVYGQVAAGIPIEAIENIEDYEELNASDYPVGEYIALKIHGSSMQPKMDEGDVVIVHCKNDVNSGEVAIVMVNGENATCKKIKKTENGIFLISTNPAFEPIFYSNDEIEKLPVRIIGKVVELRAKF